MNVGSLVEKLQLSTGRGNVSNPIKKVRKEMVKSAAIPETFKFHLENSVAFRNDEQYRPVHGINDLA